MSFRFTSGFYLKKCFKKIKLLISLHTCTLISELPSDISTRELPSKKRFFCGFPNNVRNLHWIYFLLGVNSEFQESLFSSDQFPFNFLEMMYAHMWWKAAWYLYYMVTENMLRTYEGIYIFSGKKIRFVTALGLIKCLKQIKSQIFLLTCVP